MILNELLVDNKDQKESTIENKILWCTSAHNHESPINIISFNSLQPNLIKSKYYHF